MLAKKLLAQLRATNTTATTVYSPNAGETVQVFVKIANTSASEIKVRVFNHNVGSTLDESTAIAWDVPIASGEIFEMESIFMDDENGNIGYRTDTANAATITIYGIVQT